MTAPISADEARRLREAATPIPWVPTWFDESPIGETYGVRCEGEVVCYTNRFKQGYFDAVLIAEAPRFAFEVKRLNNWKQEAAQVIEEWEKIHEVLGKPGKLGESKAVASLREIERLINNRKENDDG